MCLSLSTVSPSESISYPSCNRYVSHDWSAENEATLRPRRQHRMTHHPFVARPVIDKRERLHIQPSSLITRGGSIMVSQNGSVANGNGNHTAQVRPPSKLVEPRTACSVPPVKPKTCNPPACQLSV